MSTLAAFYTSPTFWGAVTAVATVLLIAATLARRAPKQKRLTYRQEAVPLLNRKASVELEVRRGGNRLKDPHIVEFMLINRSRQDIGSQAFDQQKPITADFGVPILEDFGCTPHPETSRPPKQEIHGTELHVLPGRIGRGDSMTYRVLVDGSPLFRPPTHQLMQGKLERDPGDASTANWLTVTAMGLAMVITAGVALIAAWSDTEEPVAVAPALPVATLIVGALALLPLWLERLSKRIRG